jgi:5-methylcytosine-specific restriction endonuclease McrA
VKQCSKCGETKPITDFNNHAKTKDGKRGQCRLCEKIARDKYYETHKRKQKKYSEYTPEEKLRKLESTKRWNKNHKTERTLAMSKRRALKKNNGVFSVSKKEIQKIQSQNCFYCGSKGGEVDHVIPLSKGGTHSIGNLVSACRSCNASKNNHTITEWKKAKENPGPATYN